MASITVTPNKHWLLYPLLIAAVCGAIWLWRDTANRDIAAIQAAAEAYKTQQTSDKKVIADVQAAQATLAKQNQSLQSQLNAAKTQNQQIDLINKLTGTDIPQQVPNPSLPDSPISVSPQDITKLTVDSVECAEDKNQVAADQIQIAGDKTQIDSRDATLKAYEAEIKSLKGGSHMKRFFKAAKYWGIGAGVGVVTGIILEKKNGF